MPVQDTIKLKEKIISLFRNKGPSLPVQIAKEVDLSILFTSAFLSELLGEKKIKMSNMRVGSSPVYYLPGQESSLEKYSEHLKNKEKEAYLLLKESSFLNDSELEPAIRVAIRSIKDFAVPVNKNGVVWWKYFTVDESNIPVKKVEEIKALEIIEKKVERSVFQEVKEEKKLFQEDNLNILEKKEHKESKKRTIKKKVSAKPKSNEKFLDKVKEFLSKSSVEIISIEGLKKEELILKIKIHGEEQLLIAYDKKKITEKEIIKAAKKASEFEMKYSILSLGELPKKVSDLIEALQNMKNIGRVE